MATRLNRYKAETRFRSEYCKLTIMIIITITSDKIVIENVIETARKEPRMSSNSTLNIYI